MFGRYGFSNNRHAISLSQLIYWDYHSELCGAWFFRDAGSVCGGFGGYFFDAFAGGVLGTADCVEFLVGDICVSLDEG